MSECQERIGRRIRSVFGLCFVLIAVSLFLSAYLCPDHVCGRSSGWESGRYPRLSLKHVIHDSLGKSLNSMSSNPFEGRTRLSFSDLLSRRSFTFDIKQNDVIVFLHIQKTGGTSFGRHLVRDLDLETPCVCPAGKKRCKCSRTAQDENRVWLFSRYSIGWKCGLHADWTELTHCVDNVMDETERKSVKRRYFYVTLLRDPVARFVSEWRHVQRGATWKTSRHWCGGRTPSPQELPACYSGADWKNVTMDEFLNCSHNLAVNRQTRMLADLTLIGCYNSSVMSQKERDVLVLASAKENLRRTAFFGICENQTVSQYLFETTFGLFFKKPFIQLNQTRSSLILSGLSSASLQRIRELNHLDAQLYDYAVQLMTERFDQMRNSDPHFHQHFDRMDPRFWEPDESDEKLMKRIEKEKMVVRRGPVDDYPVSSHDTSNLIQFD